VTLSPVEEHSQIPARSFLQSQFWASFKCTFGWSKVRLQVHGAEASVYEISILVRNLAGPFSFAYIPHGPEFDGPQEKKQAHLEAIGEALKQLLPRFCLFLRFDPAWYVAGLVTSTSVRQEFSSLLIKGSDVQPPDTVVLDLSLPDDEILASMKPKWRYNIRLAEKKNVLITEESSAALDIFYGLYQQTAARDRIAVHPKSYYEKLFDLAGSFQSADKHLAVHNGDPDNGLKEPAPDLRLWVARHEGQAVACIVTLYYGHTATYLYGASSDEKRNLMPAYALQWAAIKAAKATGCLEYDMFGIPPTQDEQHPMAGLYRFKTGFGGEIRHYPGAWDYVYLPLWYSVFRAAERIRLFWHKRLRKNQG